jgi:RNA polymerase sigma factor (sigma-70 family)
MIEAVELKQRLDTLHRKHYVWLLQSATNITKNREDSEDLIGDLYVYLSDKGNPKIYYSDSFNLMYCYRYLQTRWINKIHQSKKLNLQSIPSSIDVEDEPYPMEEDIRMMIAYDEIQTELERLETTRMWPKARLFQLYYGSDDYMIEIANKIGISKSTTFIAIKRVREHLKEIVKNPFNDKDNTEC